MTIHPTPALAKCTQPPRRVAVPAAGFLVALLTGGSCDSSSSDVPEQQPLHQKGGNDAQQEEFRPEPAQPPEPEDPKRDRDERVRIEEIWGAVQVGWQSFPGENNAHVNSPDGQSSAPVPGWIDTEMIDIEQLMTAMGSPHEIDASSWPKLEKDRYSALLVRHSETLEYAVAAIKVSLELGNQVKSHPGIGTVRAGWAIMGESDSLVQLWRDHNMAAKKFEKAMVDAGADAKAVRGAGRQIELELAKGRMRAIEDQRARDDE